MRLPALALLVLFAGCANGPRTLDQETEPVGVGCSPGSLGRVTGDLGCLDPTIGTHDAGFLLDGILHLAFCDSSQVGSGEGCGIAGRAHIIVDVPTLGPHRIEDGAASLSRSGNMATSGTVIIDGYDPTTGAVCGTYEAVLGATVVSGTFDALDVCD